MIDFLPPVLMGEGRHATAGGTPLGHKDNTAVHTSGDRCGVGGWMERRE